MPTETIFNIGNGYVSSFDEVLAAVRALCPALNYEVEPGEPPHSKLAPLDISRAKRHLGWDAAFALQVGVRGLSGGTQGRARASDALTRFEATRSENA